MRRLLAVFLMSASVVGRAWAGESSSFPIFPEDYRAEIKTAAGSFTTAAILFTTHASKQLDRAYGDLSRSTGGSRTLAGKFERAITTASLLSAYYGGVYLTGDGLHDLDQKYAHGFFGNAVRDRVNADVSVTELKRKVLPATKNLTDSLSGSPYAVTWGAN